MDGRLQDQLTAFKATTKIADYIKDCTEDELMADNAGGIKYDKEFYQELSFKLKESDSSILKINEKCVTYIDEFWKDLSAQFHLPPLPILLDKIREGCIEVTWLVPASIACIINAESLFKESMRANEFYQQHGVVRVMLNNEVIYKYIPKHYNEEGFVDTGDCGLPSFIAKVDYTSPEELIFIKDTSS